MLIEGIKEESPTQELEKQISEISSSKDPNKIVELREIKEKVKNPEKIHSHEDIRNAMEYSTRKEQVKLVSSLIGKKKVDLRRIEEIRGYDTELPSEGGWYFRFNESDPYEGKIFKSVVDKFDVLRDKLGLPERKLIQEATLMRVLGNDEDPSKNTVVMVTGKFDKGGIFLVNDPDPEKERVFSVSTLEEVNEGILSEDPFKCGGLTTEQLKKRFRDQHNGKKPKKFNEHRDKEIEEMDNPDKWHTDEIRKNIIEMNNGYPKLMEKTLAAEKKIYEEVGPEIRRITKENKEWDDRVSTGSANIVIEMITSLSKLDEERAREEYKKIWNLWSGSSKFVEHVRDGLPKSVKDIVGI